MPKHERELSLPAARRRDPLGVHRATLSDLEGGKATLSPEMTLRIDEAEPLKMIRLYLGREESLRERPRMHCLQLSSADLVAPD